MERTHLTIYERVRSWLPVVAMVLVLSTGMLTFMKVGPTPALAACHRLAIAPGYQDRCYRVGAQRLIEQLGPTRALPSLDRRARSEQRLRELCHPMMHVTGRAHGRTAHKHKNPTKLLSGMPSSPRNCGSGYIHGVIEGYIEASGGISTVDDELVTLVCRGRRSGYRYFACVHGVGHALYRSMNKDVRGSLQRCNGLRVPEKYECSSAVVMGDVEGVAFEGGNMVRESTSPARARSWCDSLPGKGTNLCYRWLPMTNDFQTGLSYREVIELCTSLPSGDKHTMCLIGVGQLAVRTGAPDTLRQQCAAILAARDRVPCIYGGIVNRAINTSSSVSTIAKLCPGLDSPDDLTCYMSIGRLQSFMQSDSAGGTSLCGQLQPGARREWCEEGARLVNESLDGSPRELAVIHRLESVAVSHGSSA